MSLANDHKNLASSLDAAPRADPTSPTQVRAKIEEHLRALGDAAGRRGGTIYIPRVRGGQLWIDVTNPLRIPREITLSLAPGVVLVPVFLRGAGRGAESHLELEGVFTAPLATIFATPGWFQRNGAAGAARYEVGAVRLTCAHLERVHPEWWGAAAPDDRSRPDDSEALAAAVRAGLLDRVSHRSRSRPPLRALAIELRSTYALGEPLQLTRETTGVERGLELRGVPGAETQPTFRCAELASIRTAMVEVEGIEAVTLVDLRFDGGGRAASCLSIRGTHTDPTARAHVLRRCGFRDAYGPLVSYRPSDSSRKQGPTTLGTRSEGLQIEHCRFERKPTSVDPRAALDVAAPPTSTVELRGCTFRGVASAMIHARSCALAATSCRFHNARIPPSLRTGNLIDLHANGPEGGVDIFLDRMNDGPAATLYAQDCVSHSVQFLVTTHAADTSALGDSTVVALHHARRVALVEGRPGTGGELRKELTLAPDGTVDPPPDKNSPKLVGQPIDPGNPLPKTWGMTPPAVIDWLLQPGPMASKLVLVGCRFDGDLLEINPAVRGFPGSGDVIDLGVLHGDGRGDLVEVNDPTRHVQVPTWPHRG